MMVKSVNKNSKPRPYRKTLSVENLLFTEEGLCFLNEESSVRHIVDQFSDFVSRPN